MRKLLLVLALAAASVPAFAATDDSGADQYDIMPLAAVDNVTMHDVVEMLQNIQAFVFLNSGEDRDFTDVFARSKTIFTDVSKETLQSYKWEVANDKIATVHTETGILTGGEFGETFLTVTDNNGEEHLFAVFVSPCVTVLSPEGVIYKYQKMYNQPVRVRFTSGKNYHINCVMAKGIGETDEDKAKFVNITDAVDGENIEDDGWLEYIEEKLHPVKNDLVFIVSEESVISDAAPVVGPSGLDVEVVGQKINFRLAVDSTSTEDERKTKQEALKNAIHPEVTVTFTDVMKDNITFVETIEPADEDDENLLGTISVGREGAFLLSIPNIERKFKVILHNLSNL